MEGEEQAPHKTFQVLSSQYSACFISEKGVFQFWVSLGGDFLNSAKCLFYPQKQYCV